MPTNTTTYYVTPTLMGWAVMMMDDEGRKTCIESGIKRWDSAKKRAEQWQKREEKARAKAGAR